MITKLTEIHSYPHSVMGCVFKELGEIVSFVSLFFYKFRKGRKAVYGEKNVKKTQGERRRRLASQPSQRIRESRNVLQLVQKKEKEKMEARILDIYTA